MNRQTAATFWLFGWVTLLAVGGMPGCDTAGSSESTSDGSSSALAEGTESTKRPSSESSTSGDPDSQAVEPTLSESAWKQVGEMYQQAKASGETTAANASQWMSDLWDSTSANGAEISKSTRQWLTAQYLTAKETGTTSAESANQYFQQEIKKMGAWEYRVSRVPGDTNRIADEMNQLGAERWECFSVTTGDEGTQLLYFRRRMKSDFDNIPTRDLVRIMMTLAGSGILGGSAAE